MRIVAADDDRSFSVVGYQEGREVESALTVPLDFSSVGKAERKQREPRKEIC